MGLLSGLEKFGLGGHADIDITKQLEPEKKAEPIAEEKKEEKKEPDEMDFLLARNFVCPVCDRKFKALAVRSTRLRRLEPDFDLRPRCQYIDVIKYDTVLCPSCGYAAMGNYFEPLSSFQIKRLKEQVMSKYKPVLEDKGTSTYSYEDAITRYQLCLVSAMVKNSKMSEKAYICLKTAWLYREIYDNTPDFSKEEVLKRRKLKEQYDGFYRQAYDGFIKAVSSEAPPFCGMNMNTMEYLLANMSVYFQDVPVATRYISNLITSKTISSKMKDRALDLKDQLLEIKETKRNQDK